MINRSQYCEMSLIASTVHVYCCVLRMHKHHSRRYLPTSPIPSFPGFQRVFPPRYNGFVRRGTHNAIYQKKCISKEIEFYSSVFTTFFDLYSHPLPPIGVLWSWNTDTVYPVSGGEWCRFWCIPERCCGRGRGVRRLEPDS